ncbi:uncharacterized protein IL334_007154 [Kwoniella shivajii]|uniref:Uncharacterized protein n=1 Tax=Kwoniella shivajii TaxID=564305 RepID=A0ABZ1DA08_9TREE|nr:hypothetical protein IL334_007154 [Kwoniella shivajii]
MSDTATDPNHILDPGGEIDGTTTIDLSEPWKKEVPGIPDGRVGDPSQIVSVLVGSAFVVPPCPAQGP